MSTCSVLYVYFSVFRLRLSTSSVDNTQRLIGHDPRHSASLGFVKYVQFISTIKAPEARWGIQSLLCSLGH